MFFGNLGENASNLIEFFENAPEVSPMPLNVNPATWMLDIIGAGTAVAAGGSGSSVDYAAHYANSTLAKVNLLHLETLMTPNEGSKKMEDEELEKLNNMQYNSSYMTQFCLLMNRIHLTYWRTPSYSVVRHLMTLLLALIFGSAYPQQEYSTYIAAMSRSAVIYVTTLFCGILAMLSVGPVINPERPVFYREQQSRMYAVWVYALTLVLIEVSALFLFYTYLYSFRYLTYSWLLYHLLYLFSILLDLIILEIQQKDSSGIGFSISYNKQICSLSASFSLL